MPQPDKRHVENHRRDHVQRRALVVSNTSGTLAAGQSFKLFEATGYSGSFSSINLPALGANLAWTNRLATDGTIAVFSTAPATPPVFNSVITVGNDLVMSGTNGPANSSYYLLGSTNVALPMTNWSRLATKSIQRQRQFQPDQSHQPGTTAIVLPLATSVTRGVASVARLT